jgi:serine/threonine protein kinase
MHPLADTGRVIAGRYRLEAPIGRGAMGVVWRAHDQLLDREVAVKEVQIADTLTEAERANAFQRTLREAKTAARLNHPAVVTVYDVAADGGRPWIVMQLVHAQSLDQVLATSGPLSPRRAAEVGRQLLSALSVAHAAGVMHRDVKPSNVLLGGDDRAVLTDFGIATFQGDPRLTQTGMVMGSPGFTAPERIRGEDASPASDLWSLGATLFAAVEGHGPFERRGGAITTMSAIINEDAPDAPTAGALGPVIAALLRREPAARPDARTAVRMITDVLPLLPDHPPTAVAGYEPTALSSRAPGRAEPGGPASGAPGRAGPGGPGAGAPGRAGPGGPGAGAPGRPVSDETSVDVLASGDTLAQEALGGGSPPPDFSSWYSPSPGGAGSGRQGQPGPGRQGQPGPGRQGQPGSAPWSGPAYQPQPDPASWDGTRPGYRPPRRRSGLWWMAALVALALIGAGAGVAAVRLLHHNQTGGHGGSSGTLPPASLLITNAINTPATSPLPSGFAPYAQQPTAPEEAGFRLAAPTSWVRQVSGYQTHLRDPSGAMTGFAGTFILIDLTPHTYPNMVREAEYLEAHSGFPGYQRVNLNATTIRGTPGAVWKFTWMSQGVEQEAIDLLFVLQTSAGPQSYALYMTAPYSKFDQMRPIFDEEVETFTPLPR